MKGHLLDKHRPVSECSGHMVVHQTFEKLSACYFVIFVNLQIFGQALSRHYIDLVSFLQGKGSCLEQKGRKIKGS